MKIAIAVLTAAALLTATACEKKTTPPANPAPKTTGSTTPTVPNVDTTKVGEKAGAALEGAKDKTAAVVGDAKDKMVAAFESGMASAKTKLDEWGTKVSAASAEKKPEMQAALDKLKSSFSSLGTDLGSLKSKTGEEWDKAWASIKSSWASFETSMNDFTAKYKP